MREIHVISLVIICLTAIILSSITHEEKPCLKQSPEVFLSGPTYSWHEGTKADACMKKYLSNHLKPIDEQDAIKSCGLHEGNNQ